MKYLLIMILLFPILLYSQPNVKVIVPFVAGNDTIVNTDPDTLDMQIGINSLNMGPWESLVYYNAANDTVYITADDKIGERLKIYNLSEEDWWMWSEVARLRIRNSADTLTSAYFSIGQTWGMLTVFVQPDTIGDSTADTLLYKVRVAGQ